MTLPQIPASEAAQVALAELTLTGIASAMTGEVRLETLGEKSDRAIIISDAPQPYARLILIANAISAANGEESPTFNHLNTFAAFLAQAGVNVQIEQKPVADSSNVEFILTGPLALKKELAQFGGTLKATYDELRAGN